MEAHHEPDLQEAKPGISTYNPEDSEESEEDFDDDDDDDDDDGDDEYEDDDEEFEPMTPEARMRRDRAKAESLLQRLSTERVLVRVNEIIIKGNTKTRHSLIASEVEPILRDATSFQQLLRAASVANARLQRLDLFDSVTMTLDAGPPELPGSANVVVEVSEEKNPLAGELGIYSTPEARTFSLEGSLKLKNLFGYGDLWDGSVAYGCDQSLGISTGVSLPKFKALATPFSARISLLSPDWLKFSSLREQVYGLSLGLLSTGNHDLTCNLSWRSLTDPSQMSSDTLRRPLGHNLFSDLKYAFKIDRRDSIMRPTRGYAFGSTTQIGGLLPDIRSLCLIRQEFDLRCAIPFGFYRSALNFGISGGALFPWGSRYLNAPSYFPESFFMGGNASPVCSLRGQTSILGFKGMGLGPAESRRIVRDNSNDGNSVISGMDHRGGDLALTAFADFSFDLPLSILREAGVHGHVFAFTGSLNKLTENAYKEFSLQKLRDSFRSSAGFGIIIPTKLFRMEVNYCYIWKKNEHAEKKTGVHFSFSSVR